MALFHLLSFAALPQRTQDPPFAPETKRIPAFSKAFLATQALKGVVASLRTGQGSEPSAFGMQRGPAPSSAPLPCSKHSSRVLFSPENEEEERQRGLGVGEESGRVVGAQQPKKLRAVRSAQLESKAHLALVRSQRFPGCDLVGGERDR